MLAVDHEVQGRLVAGRTSAVCGHRPARREAKLHRLRCLDSRGATLYPTQRPSAYEHESGKPVMSTHPITAGHGYTYLTRQTAAQDASVVSADGLGAYYSEHGEAPGQWMGSG